MVDYLIFISCFVLTFMALIICIALVNFFIYFLSDLRKYASRLAKYTYNKNMKGDK